jgi:hypothetical protein
MLSSYHSSPFVHFLPRRPFSSIAPKTPFVCLTLPFLLLPSLWYPPEQLLTLVLWKRTDHINCLYIIRNQVHKPRFPLLMFGNFVFP